MHTLLKLFSLALVVLTTGCAQMTMGTPQPTAENTASLRQAKLAEARVGAFTLDAGKPAQMDKGHSLRGAQMQAPTNGSFAEYLRESLRVELAAAGLLNPQADAVISGFLTHTDVAPDIGTGTAALSARFVVTRGGAKRYEQELSVQSEWESSFMGAVAVPAAAQQYEGLYRKLVGRLVADPAFRQALAK
ncbi:MAG: hypothetical protein HEQ37_15275 [Acidovorax sp.]|jgi:hypothetical protein|nr:hypothetical protein [Acidovorax sp.]